VLVHTLDITQRVAFEHQLLRMTEHDDLTDLYNRRYFEQRLKAALGTDRIAIVIVEIAAQAGMQTVAEGVEDAGALALLREYGVDYAQGFHIHRPGPLTED
jgi:predicted signal transduction protein with EAL and GGDEF domain